MAVVVEVCTEKIHIAFFNQFFSRFFLFPGIASGKRKHIDLKQIAGTVKFIVTVGMLLEVIEETLWMSEYRAVAFQFQVKQKLIKLPGLLNKRILHKNVIVGIGRDISGCQLSAEIVIDAVFRRTAQINADFALGEFAFKSIKRPVERFRRIFKRAFSDVRSGYDAADAP